jgi:membrane-bound serine protease (ClpP class)
MGCSPCAALAWTAWAQTPADKGAPPAGAVLVLQLDGIIGPASADFVHRGLARAQRSGARLVVLQMDTPAGSTARCG